MSTNGHSPELVNIIIDGKNISVPKGTNLIEAAKMAGIEIPYYCYHPHLSVAGNCRMCQVQVKGAPKLDIACNTQVREGMEVATQFSSQAVKDAQSATLEFILINHPLDCTVCDQAGHCKLQDYHYEYNARPSRFLENKEHKVKAEPLGPHVILDGERCIMCTRCIRFCDEVTETSELGMLNRGDRSVISINQERELNNALSGTVVDLCPVGALTHRDWRFNTRIWFAKETDSVCPGCSTGCNVKVGVRDGEVVQVKARLNSEVNKEWLCDEGRYGFGRFLPKQRIQENTVSGNSVTLKEAAAEVRRVSAQQLTIFISPDLLLEDYQALKSLIDKSLKGARVVLAYEERKLSSVEAKLVSPDYACNFRAAEFAELVSGDHNANYKKAISDLISGSVKHVMFVGDRSILSSDQEQVSKSIFKTEISVSILTDASSQLANKCRVQIAGRSILERSGLMINRQNRLQYADCVLEPIDRTVSDWKVFSLIASEFGVKASAADSDRSKTIETLSSDPRLSTFKIYDIKQGGIQLKNTEAMARSHAQEEARP
jgi:NADH-quinone oxidoreductase subunit G